MTTATVYLLSFHRIIILILICITLSKISNANFVSKIACSTANNCANGNYLCPQGQDCSIECDGGKVCAGATFTCPDNYNCRIDVTGDFSFVYGTIIGGHHGNLILNCSNSDDATYGCLGSEIYCPSYGDCNITSSKGHGEFRHASFYSAPTTRILYIRTDSASKYALRVADIYCPESYNAGPNSCIIDVAGNGAELYRVHIYALESFNDVSLICRYASDAADGCWNGQDDTVVLDSYTNMPIMHCGPATERSSCKMELVNGYDGWQCVDWQNAKCQGYTLPPTSNPTANPIVIPTAIPTVIPTAIPTVKPTHFTAYPTAKAPANLIETTYTSNTSTSMGIVQTAKTIQIVRGRDNSLLIVAVIACIILALMFIVCILIYLKTQKNNTKNENEQNRASTKIDISSNATPSTNIDDDNLEMTELPKLPSIPKMNDLSKHVSLNVNDDEETQSNLYDNPEGVQLNGDTVDVI